MENSILKAIYQRRSIREFTDQAVEIEQLHEIIKAGIWAPSGLNNQPWRFVIITEQDTREKLAALTKYSHIVLAAPASIAVFLDTTTIYDQVKDHQAAGACIQNMLLAAESLDLGAVWLGQILKNKSAVNALLQLDNQYDLMAVIAIGNPAHHNQKSTRKDLQEFILNQEKMP